MAGGVSSSGRRPGSWPPSEVQGKVALLTGGTEEDGIHLAVEFVKRGCRVVLIGHPLARIANACNLICWGAANETIYEQIGESEQPLRCDDSQYVRGVELDTTQGEESYAGAVEEAWRAFGGIQIFVNCASVSGTMKPVLETKEQEYDEIMEVNVKFIWMLSTALARKMRAARTGGSYVFLTSIAGTERGIYPGVSIYGTSMAATNHLTKMMAMELGKYGIRVNSIACGLKSSDIMFQSKEKERIQETADRIVPLQRWLQLPHDILGVVLWLVGDSSVFVTGTITIVDGGQSICRPRLTSYL